MATMDVFNADPFSLRNMTAAVNEQDFVPSMLRNMGLFRPRGITTTTFQIEKKGSGLSLVPTTPRGAAPIERTRDPRSMRALNTVRLSKQATIYADQVQGVRAFGTESDVEQVEMMVNQEVDVVRSEIDMTEENIMLGAIKGQILDADGSSVIYNLFNEFDVKAPAAIAFDLSNPDTKVRGKCSEVIRTMGKAMKAGGVQFKVHALCSDSFFDDLINHPDVERAYERYQEGVALRGDYTYQSFEFAGITFWNYHGSDDGNVSVADGEARFFANGVPGLFETVYAPADTMETVNTIGLPRYALPFRDPRDKYMAYEIQCNLMAYCTRPQTLLRGTA